MKRERKIFYREIDRDIEKTKIEARLKNYSPFILK